MSLSSSDDRSTKPRSVTAEWSLGRSAEPGDRQVVTLRIFGQRVNVRGPMAVHLYHEYTWQK